MKPTMPRRGMLGVLALAMGCTFNVEVTSQRTALENQVMGAYKELDDDLVLVSSVRGGTKAAADVPAGKQRAVMARLNQDFNRDDIEELKDRGYLGEATDGRLFIMPAAAKAQDEAGVRLAKALTEEENADRTSIWARIIATNPNLSPKDLPEVRRTYARLQRDAATSGQWFQDEGGQWRQKGAP